MNLQMSNCSKHPNSEFCDDEEEPPAETDRALKTNQDL